MLHLAYNSDQHSTGMVPNSKPERHGPTLKMLLDWLIREDKGGQECSMFVERGDMRITGGDTWCSSFRHRQRIEDRNSDAPCLFCMVEGGMLHAETYDA